MSRPRLLAVCMGVVLGALGGMNTSAQSPARDITAEAIRGERRVALVIGNSAYPVGPLRNPANDARAMARNLADLGFEVIAHTDLNYREMRRAIVEFGQRLQGSGVGLFFFAGHGLQVNGRNYLVPVDAQIASESEAEVESVDVATVLARMETARNRANVVILDACRDNPLTRRFRSYGSGLAAIDAPSGTLIAYATAPGKLAWDGEGPNGVYTGELLATMRLPGLRIEDVFRRVRAEVQRKTKGQQTPWESSSLVGDLLFLSPPTGVPTTRPEDPGAQSVPPTPQKSPEKKGPTVVEEDGIGYGSLAFHSSADRTEIFLGDQRLGEVRPGRRLIATDVPSGKHLVVARQEGRPISEQQVEVRANQRTEVSIDLPNARNEIDQRGDVFERPIYVVGQEWVRNDGTYVLRRIEGDRYIFVAGEGRELHVTKDLFIARQQDGTRWVEQNCALRWPLRVGEWSGGPCVWSVDAIESIEAGGIRYRAARIVWKMGSLGSLTTLKAWYAPEARQIVRMEAIGQSFYKSFHILSRGTLGMAATPSRRQISTSEE